MKLAVNGGEPVRARNFPAYCTIGEEEKSAVERVIDSGILSKYLGCWHDNFLGGPEVRHLEEEWATYFGVKHAIAVNSCTSGIYCAVGATHVEPGDEIIVTPYSMSCSATAPLVYNAIPVFADIEEDCFCLDPASVRSRITPRTRAIIVVDLFGQPYDVEQINAISDEHDLIVIEDCAQAPGVHYKERFAGTLGSIGIYSLNYHKHIHCGEGGIVVTDDDILADRIRLIRNHAESVVGDKGVDDLVNMLGFNYRMTELEAAVTRCQLGKLSLLVAQRQEHCAYIERGLSDIPALIPPKVRDAAEHAYYVHAFRFDEATAGVPRNRFAEALRAELAVTELREDEGVKVDYGYVKPIYLQPMFQKRVVYGSSGYPFSMYGSASPANYSKGLCPVVERMHERELLTHELMHSQMSTRDLDDVIEAFRKVWECRTEIR